MPDKLAKLVIAGSPVFIGAAALERLGSDLQDILSGKETTFILADENTLKYCYPNMISAIPQLSVAHKIVIHSGEINKTLKTCELVWKELAVSGGNRRSLLINLGGGMVTDLGGFAASVFHRGLDFVNIPTSLMGMIDASLGGKTGLDLDSLKNQIGLFSTPRAVYVWPGFLSTLPHREMRSGYSEMLKHALIYDADYWSELAGAPLSLNDSAEGLIKKSVEIKGAIVNSDPYEIGLRRKLNFGHTLGHAFETYSLRHDKNPLTHGEAIAMGMICEAYISYRTIDFSPGQLNEVVKLLLRNFSHYRISNESIDELIEISGFDKKNEKGNLSLTLLKSIGDSLEGRLCNPDILKESLLWFIELKSNSE
ncbi:MAG: 3-dehydroquinate synthase [Lentimicrobium sp.]|nr:3-dehydroquinate synthase [Lentimicrobium sp.]